MLEYLTKDKIIKNMKVLFKSDGMKRLENIRYHSMNNIYESIANEECLSDKIKKIEEYPKTFHKNRSTAQILAYSILEQIHNEALTISNDNKKKMTNFIYNAGIAEIRDAYPSLILEPLGVSQSNIVSDFKNQYKTFKKSM